MESLQQLMARLRRERGLTQTRLAQLAGVDADTINKGELGKARSWRPTTARRILESLHAAGPMPEPDVQAFGHYTGLKAVVLPRETPEGFRPARGLPTLERAQSLVLDLSARFGLEFTTRLLELLLTAPTQDVDEQMVTIAKPERQINLGGVPVVEQEFSHYTRPAPPPGGAGKKRKAE